MNMDSQAARHWVVDLCGHSLKYYLPNRRGIEEKCTREPAYRQSRDSSLEIRTVPSSTMTVLFVEASNLDYTIDLYDWDIVRYA